VKSEIEVPDGWKVESLKNITNVKDGNWILAKYYTEKGVRLLQIGDIGQGCFLDKSNKFISEESAKELNCKFVKQGEDILVSRMPDPIGRACISPVLEYPCIVAVDISMVRVTDNIEKKFLLNFLNKESTLQKMKLLATGATRQRISRKKLETIRVPIPPSREQQKIADILSKVDERIDLNEKIIDKTEELKKGLMQKLLTKGIGHTKFKKTELGEIPERWDIVKLGNCVEQRKETILPSGEGKTTYVGLEHIDSGVSWLSRCGTDFSIKSLKYKFSENNILYGKLRPYLDKAVLTTKEGICSTDIVVIQSKENSLNEFILPILHSKRFLDYANSTTKGSNLPRTSWNSISKFIIPFPSLDEQKQIASILSKVDEQIQDNKKELKHLQELKKGLMQDLLTGKVRVSV